MAKSDLRLGLIGAGPWGRTYIGAIAAIDGLKLTRLASRNPESRSLVDPACLISEDWRQVAEALDLDGVIIATPPHFRPQHVAAAVAANKHIFMEKPVAVDPTGVRRIIAASEQARRKGLAIVGGTQRRHQASYLETMRRIEDGAIGEPVAAQCYWNQGGLWVKKHKPEWSDMEWQCRNWLYFYWLSGDHICEQHIHNLDVINWAMGGPPVKAMAYHQGESPHAAGDNAHRQIGRASCRERV